VFVTGIRQNTNHMFAGVDDPSWTPQRALATPALAIGESQAACATHVWRDPDQGMWEARGKPQHYVSSNLMCWVALDRASKLAQIRGDPDAAATWRATAEEIRTDCPDSRRQAAKGVCKTRTQSAKNFPFFERKGHIDVLFKLTACGRRATNRRLDGIASRASIYPDVG
jgi:hypothetical protein